MRCRQEPRQHPGIQQANLSEFAFKTRNGTPLECSDTIGSPLKAPWKGMNPIPCENGLSHGMLFQENGSQEENLGSLWFPEKVSLRLQNRTCVKRFKLKSPKQVSQHVKLCISRLCNFREEKVVNWTQIPGVGCCSGITSTVNDDTVAGFWIFSLMASKLPFFSEWSVPFE